MTTNQNEPGAPDGWNYGSGDCTNPACRTFGDQCTFRRRKGSTDPRRCVSCRQPERYVADTEPAPPANNGHGVDRLVPRVAPPSSETVKVAERIVAQHIDTTVRCAAGAHVYVMGASKCRLCGYSDAPVVMPGATTAIELAHANALVRATAAFALANAKLEVERDSYEKSLEARSRDLGLMRAERDQAIAERDADRVWAQRETLRLAAERDVVREQLRDLARIVLGWLERPYTTRFDDLSKAARAALDPAPAPRPAIEALVAAVDEIIADSLEPVGVRPVKVSRDLWNALRAARGEYEKERQSK